MPHPLDCFFNPRSITVAGASNNVTTMGTMQLLNLLNDRFPGPIYCIHRSEESVFGLPTFKSPAELPEATDTALIVIPARHVPEMIDGLGRRGTKTAIVITAGFRELGTEEGRRLERELVETARRHGMRIVGPNCMGIISPPAKFNTTVHPYVGAPGRVALLSQSGTYVTQVLHYLGERGWGFSRAASMGNSADVNVIDGLDYLAQDEATGAVAMYIEGIPDGRAFLEAAQRCSRAKPVVALYVGGSDTGARVSASHTGALAGSGDVHAGAFAQAGIVQVDRIEDLYASAHALAHTPPMRGPRVGIITNSGGPAASIADTISRLGLLLPEFSPALQAKLRSLVPPTGTTGNPVDITFDMDTESFLVKIVDAVISSGEVDGAVIHGPIGSLFMDAMARVVGHRLQMDNAPMIEMTNEIIDRSVGLIKAGGLPVVISAFWGKGDSSIDRYHSAGVPCHMSPESAVRSLRALYDRGRFEVRFTT
jgi:acetyltransferase